MLHFNASGNLTPPVAVNIYSAATVKAEDGEDRKGGDSILVSYVGDFFCVYFQEWFCTFLT